MFTTCALAYIIAWVIIKISTPQKRGNFFIVNKVKTLVCTQPGNLDYKTAENPVLTQGHAIIKIKRIGICGTDLHAFEGTQPYFNYPRILGHELAGELMEFDNAPGFKTGEQVTFIPYFNCGTCIACRSGKPNCCVNLKVCGVHVDGGMAEYLSVPSHSLVHGDGLSYDELALIEPLAVGAHALPEPRDQKRRICFGDRSRPDKLTVLLSLQRLQVLK